MSQKLIIKEEILTKDTKVGAHTLDDHSFIIYRWAICEMHVTDPQEIKHDFQQLFLTADIVYYDIILKWLWLTEINSDCDWPIVKWSYRDFKKETLKDF